MPTKQQKETQLDRYARLLAAFGGNVEDWEFTNIVDCGPESKEKCPCGHPIRYKCIWEHPAGRHAHTGNVCVHTVPGLSELQLGRMETALEKLIADQKEVERRKREDKLAGEVATLTLTLQQYQEEASNQVSRLRHDYGYGWIPDNIYSHQEKLQNVLDAIRIDIKQSNKMRTARGQHNRLVKCLELCQKQLPNFVDQNPIKNNEN